MNKEDRLDLLRQVEVLSQVTQLKIALPKFQDARNVAKGVVPTIVSTYELSLFYQDQQTLKNIQNKIVDLLGEIYGDMEKASETKDLVETDVPKVNDVIQETGPLEVVK